MRTARLYEAACGFAFFNREPACSPQDPVYADALDLVRPFSSREICPEVVNARLSELEYTRMLPVPEIDEFIAAVETGFE